MVNFYSIYLFIYFNHFVIVYLFICYHYNRPIVAYGLLAAGYTALLPGFSQYLILQ